MRRQLNRDDAEDIAISGLGFLASDPERLDRFLSVTGLGPENLRSAAQEPKFLASVLDYIASDESLLVALAGHSGIAPERVGQAHLLLAGPAAGHD